MRLGWTDGEGFEVIEERERDLVTELIAWLAVNPYSTSKEAATKKEVKRADGTTERIVPGIQAREVAVKEALNANLEVFSCRTGAEAKAVGRHSSAQVWEVREGAPTDSAHLGAPAPSRGDGNVGAPVRPPLRGAPATDAAPLPAPQVRRSPGAAQRTFDDEGLDDGDMTT
jgi:hypothetical protein